MNPLTPGPWKVVQPKHDPQAWDVAAENGMEICRLPWRCEPNARLIAAAPELLKIAEAHLAMLYREWHSHMSREEFDSHPEVIECRAAIAKAKP